MKKTVSLQDVAVTQAIVGARVGRPARISLEEIARVTLKIGLDDVTMIGVGQALGVDHSSLYRYVKGRKELLLAAVNLAISEIKWGAKADNWRIYAEATAESLWLLLDTHCGLADAMHELEVPPPAGIHAFSEIANQFEEYGFLLEDAVLLVEGMMAMTLDCFTGWHKLHKPQRIGDRDVTTVVQSWATEAIRHPDNARPIGIKTNIMTSDPKQWWHKKLFFILEGAAGILERRRISLVAEE